MIKYLLRPFIFLFKGLWQFVVTLLLAFRGPLLFLLSLFLASFLIAITIFSALSYHKFFYYKIDFNSTVKLFNYVEKHTLSLLLAFSLAFLFFWWMLKRIIPDGRNIPKASSTQLRTGISLSLRKQPATFAWKTSDWYKSIIVHSPYQGIYVEGTAGAGKSQSVVEPFIYQAAQQGFSGFLYDFKGNPPTLSRTLYGALTEYKSGVQFAHINFSDPTISHRTNPLSPTYLASKLYAQEYASAILKNLNKEWAAKLDFWAENAIAYLSAIIWYLRVHHPLLCSLPHAMLIALEPPSKSLNLLNKDEEVKRMIGAISIAQEQQADKQIAGVFSSLQLPLNKLYTKELFWLLSSESSDEGHVSLDISNPLHPTFLSVANDPRLGTGFAPVIALLATVCMQHMNQQGKYKSVFILDEAPTLFIPGLESLPATARSNNIATMLCVQDFAQLSGLYGTRLAEVMRNTLGNQFFGMSGNLSTSEYVSKMAGEYTGVRWSYTDSSESKSDTASLGKEPFLNAHQVATQPPGHFIVKVAGTKPQFFSTQLKSTTLATKAIPVRTERSKLLGLIEENWKKIHQDVKKIFERV
jgi:hypothetical protein